MLYNLVRGVIMANKSDMSNKVKELYKNLFQEEISMKDAGRILDVFAEDVKDTVKRGEDIALAGFLSIKVIDVPAMVKRNPRTGAPINVEAKKRVRITPGSDLKNCVNE